MKTNSSYASGKVLLSGEYSVIFGEPAVAMCIDLGVEAKIKQNKHMGIKFDKRTDKSRIIEKAIELVGKNVTGIEIQVKSELPIGSGMGSSAAVAVAVIKALLKYQNKRITKEELYKLAFECEKIAHGNPSGVDPATVVFGGLIWFIKGEQIKSLKSKALVEILLVHSGNPRETTREMVETISKNINMSLISKIGRVTKKIKNCLLEGKDIQELINENGLLLEELGVVGKKAINISKQLRNMGCGVKISGAGGIKTGSGMLLVLGEDIDKIVEFVSLSKLPFWRTCIG